MGVPAWFLGHAAWKLLELVAEKAVSTWIPVAPSAHWVARINSCFRGRVDVLGQTAREPRLRIEGAHTLTDEQNQVAQTEKQCLLDENRPNDSHAILINEPLWLADPIECIAKTLDYAGVRALRAEGFKPAILSASAVIVCRETRELLLHMRGSSVATFPNCLHTLGGAYIPGSPANVDPDRGGLRKTLIREVNEETQLSLSDEIFPPMMLCKEIDTGFVQLVFLGFGVKKNMLLQLFGNWEGTPQVVSFDKLPDLLLQPHDWVPSGKAHILAWLALGAPNAGRSPLFGTFSAGKLFDAAVGG